MNRRLRGAAGLFSALAALISAIAAVPSFASDTVTLTLFPSESIYVTQGRVTRTFNVPATQGAFTLSIVNGDGIGGQAVSSGTVKVNGSTVVHSSELNENVRTLNKTLTNLVRGSNSIEVKVTSEHSAYVTVTITGVYLLDVGITDPAAGSNLFSDLATVSGTYAAYTGTVTVTVNGVPASAAGGTFTAAAVPLVTGVNSLTAVIVTADGIQDQASISVNANMPPVADAGDDRNVKVGSTVTLDGRNSYDPEGELISYRWSSLEVPAQSAAALDNAFSVIPSFVPDLPGSYRFSLVANDGHGDGRPDNVLVSAYNPNVPPTAVAGPDNSVVTETVVYLDGTGSYDPDGDPLGYSWQLLSRPVGSAAALSDPAAPAPNFVADMAGEYVLSLTVSDGQASSLPDNVVVISSAPNAPPIADAGPDQTISRNTIYSLDGRGSRDANNDPLAFSWHAVSRPAGSVNAFDNAASPTPSLLADAEGNYVSRLVVGDGQAQSAPDTTVVTVVNDAPIANAGADQEVLPGTLMTLNGSGSADPNGDSITYQWSIVSAPSGSGAAIVNPAAANPVFTPDLEGVYTIQLVVSDGRLSSAPDNVVVTAWSPIVTVPNVLGMTQSDAQAALSAARVTTGNVTTAYSDTVASGYVIAQSPNHGSIVSYGSACDLVVSAGPPPTPPPPDPATVAPPIDDTVVTTVDSATRFLYSGTTPIQTGVSPETIDSKRAAVLRGKVMTSDNAALSGVAITILNHPEFGRTVTREDGMFDLVVNGGGLLTIDYRKGGYLPIHRQANIPWQGYVPLPDVVMAVFDNQVTSVNLASPEPIQVARGSVVTDSDGTRQATLFFAQGTRAHMVLPDGSARALNTLNVRATEYTVGPNGPKAMPAPLPPSTAYTYCVELSVDQAVAAGADGVVFDRPISFYVENFLNFPTGISVPLGYYDRKSGVWVPSPNGRVIRIVGVTGGYADLDTDGDGSADNAAVLAALGVTDDERRQLAILHPVGTSHWRMPITHLSVWDGNFSQSLSPDATFPGQKEAPGSGTVEDPVVHCGSIIECQNQVLGETVGIAGTPFSLNYRSNRAPGRLDAYTLAIPLSGETVPASLKRIDLQIAVAGRVFTWSSNPVSNPDLRNLSYTFTWDGKDVTGRVLQGAQKAVISIGYAYDALYSIPDPVPISFGLPGRNALPDSKTRTEIILPQEYSKSIGTWDARALGLGGWSLDPHHAYDRDNQTLYLGNGTQWSVKAGNRIISTLLKMPPGDARTVIVAPDGSVYYTDTYRNVVTMIDPSGNVSTVAGGGSSAADGVPATEAKFWNLWGLALGSDGSLYISDIYGMRVRRVGPDGIITTVAGNGQYGLGEEGVYATETPMDYPEDIAIGRDGSLYISEGSSFGPRIRRVGTNGIITTVAGGGNSYANGIPATQTYLSPFRFAVGPDGGLFITEYSQGTLRRVSPEGIITGLAEGLNTPLGLAVGPDGGLYVTEQNANRVLKVRSDGSRIPVAGTGVASDDPVVIGDGGPALAASVRYPFSLAVAPDDTIYIAEQWQGTIRRAGRIFTGVTEDESAAPSEDGRAIHVFDLAGRHLRTLQSLTNEILYRFDYDPSGRLIRIVDSDNNATSITRDGSGRPTGIVAPAGQLTALGVDANGYLSMIANPAGDTVWPAVRPDGFGLLDNVIDERGYVHRFDYDSLGRLTRDDDPAGGYKTLARTETEDGYRVTLATALGRTTTFDVTSLAAGGTEFANTMPGGSLAVTRSLDSGTTTSWLSDGTITEDVEGPDPRFGMQSPIIRSSTVWSPGGLVRRTTSAGTVELANPGDPIVVRSRTDTTTINGHTYTTVYDNATLRFTTTTPSGRRSVSGIDGKGRPLSVQADNTIVPMTFSYHPNGRLHQAGQDNNIWTYLYDSKNRLQYKTDPLNNTVEYGYDDADRVNMVKLPSGRTYQFGYDGAGNRTSITMPDNNVHLLGYSPINLDNAYTPPQNPAYAHNYTLDREWDNTILPGGRVIDATYDNAGRIAGIIGDPSFETCWGEPMVCQRFWEVSVEYNYLDNTDRVSRLISEPYRPRVENSGQQIDFEYDGHLTTMTAFSGASNGEYRFAYDNNFWVMRVALDNVWNVLSRDDDGLLTGTGPFTMGRHGPAGAPDNVSDLLARSCGIDNAGLPVYCLPGVLQQTYGYDNTGRLNSRTLTVGGSVAYEVTLERDRAGRIAQKTETAGAAPAVVWRYDYDVDGQLDNVWRDSSLWEHYGYDNNGNRNAVVTQSPARNLGAGDFEYDGQDRLARMGSVAYIFDVDGFLAQRGTDTFAYSARGEILSATVGGQTTTYSYDGTGRRVVRTDMQGTTQYLYGNLSQPFQVTASRAPDNILTVYYYDDFGALYAFERGGARYYVGSDHLGTPKVITNNTGNIVRQIEYDSWGVKVNDTNPSFDLPVAFAGGIPDDATGLVRFGFRDYGPGTGRWAAKDPIFFYGGQWNLYEYVGNNPVTYSDPNGEVFPACLMAPAAWTAIVGMGVGSIAPFFFRDVPKLPPGSPPGTASPGGPYTPGSGPYTPPRGAPAPFTGPPPGLPPIP